MSAPDPRVDELRQRLRALGYLDAGVDRFVLGPATGSRRPAAIALLASLRTGIIAALLLGPAAAIGLSARLPGLVTGPRDAVVIAVYMGALFGAAVSIAAFGASLAVATFAGARVARRARVAAGSAGALVTVACLAYLTLWWRAANLGLAASPWWTGFALAVAAAISVLLGHAARLTALAVILAGRADAAPASRHSSSWKVSVGIGLLAFVGASVLLVATAPASGGERRTGSSLTVVSSGLRVRLLAIDGVDPGVLEPLSAAGRVPSLTSAFAQARATLASENTRDPARLWTTIATGQPADVHGVHGLETRKVAGVEGVVPSTEPSAVGTVLQAATDLLRLTRPAIASGTERREKTIWEVAADAGLRSVVVNWWATWPAPEENRADGPVVLSDRATLRLERGGALDAEIAPRALYERLRADWPAVRRDAAATAARLLGEAGSGDPEIRGVLVRSAELDVLQARLAESVADRQADLVALYFPGLDIAQHALLGRADQSAGPAAFAARVDALRGYYEFLDRFLADRLKPEAGVLTVVVTEPGRLNAGATGLLGLLGGPLAQGTRIDGRATDVMPTVLHALGVPVSRTLAGSPLVALFTPGYAARYPVRHVEGYGSPSAASAVRSGRPLDQEMIDRLRSLGYVK